MDALGQKAINMMGTDNLTHLHPRQGLEQYRMVPRTDPPTLLVPHHWNPRGGKLWRDEEFRVRL